ncbi:hypothetical protein HLH44_13940 [Gluconacetobacter sp. 1c LMG 22058]|uniref:Uncharacterized protein n=1 Tax=Gluconacetobacter dulcium TaxID=2729096 RepID=A0A7W4K1N6_9PROT|nr:hypothetical protein [Gluconacetobacter dulcium]MBB2198542.1 hypothetical protein [Gluconacetobacter dulcium]
MNNSRSYNPLDRISAICAWENGTDVVMGQIAEILEDDAWLLDLSALLAERQKAQNTDGIMAAEEMSISSLFLADNDRYTFQGLKIESS